MSVAACLLLYSLTVLGVCPRVLQRLTHAGDAPHFGVVAWITAITSVLASWAAAAALLVVDIAGHWHRGTVVASCLAHLGAVVSGDAGFLPQLGMLTLAVGAAVVVAVGIARYARTLTRMRLRAHEHASAVRLVGHSTAARDVVVLDAGEAAAYCVSGRPPAIVVTSAAVAQLSTSQLMAVLAHERAHLTGGHANIVAALRSLATVFPRLALMTVGAAEVSALLEMCADDAASRLQGRGALLSGLLALAGATPAGALGAADLAVLARAQRLSAPLPRRARSQARAVLMAAVTIMLASPLVIVIVAISRALTCGD